MYHGTKYRNFNEVREALRARTAVLRIAKGHSARLLMEFGSGNKSVMLSFFLPFLLPAAFLLFWYFFYAKQVIVFAALLFYLILPFVAPLGHLLATGMSVFGLVGIFRNWPILLVSMLLPAALSWLGSWLFQQFILRAVCKAALNDRATFEQLWQEHVLIIFDDDGVHQYMTREEAAAHRAQRDKDVAMRERQLAEKRSRRSGKQKPAGKKSNSNKYES